MYFLFYGQVQASCEAWQTSGTRRAATNASICSGGKFGLPVTTRVSGTYTLPPKAQRCVKVGDRVQAGQQLVVGVWHRVKVFRRIERMAEDLGLKNKGLRAGDIVQRWKRTRE